LAITDGAAANFKGRQNKGVLRVLVGSRAGVTRGLSAHEERAAGDVNPVKLDEGHCKTPSVTAAGQLLAQRAQHTRALGAATVPVLGQLPYCQALRREFFQSDRQAVLEG